MQRAVLLAILVLNLMGGRAQRMERTINAGWTFTLDKNPEKEEVVNLPHTWNAEDAFEDGTNYYRGKGMYKRVLFAPEEWGAKRVFIRFEGANQITRMWLNGHPVGEHFGGYTGFVFDLSEHLKTGSDNQLKIEVDNRYNPDVPPLEADFNFYGGIYRDVSLIVTDEVHFDLLNAGAGNFVVKTPVVTREKADLEIESLLVNNAKDVRKVFVRLNIFAPDGTLLKSSNKKLKIERGQQKRVSFEEALESPELWAPTHPKLYKAELALVDVKSQSTLDEVSSEFGCRWFRIDPGKGFFLNGEPLKLIGANRHQDFKGMGNALPNALHQRDYRLMKEMGCNFVRMAHYPQDPDVYRLCDELGMLVWSEIPVINEITNSEAFTRNCVNMQREQILQFRNHPSVVMWGYMNEIFLRMVFTRGLSDRDRKEIVSSTIALAHTLDEVTHELDPDRLSAMALHNNEIYNTTGIADIPDVIGWNLYFGWYDASLKDLDGFLDRQHKRYPERPILISEYGPGSDVRIQTNEPKPWDYSEAYQLKSHKSYYRQVMERPYVLGMAAWNFADFGSSGRQDSKPFVNQKGLRNFDRTPKNVYFYYKALLDKRPLVYIAKHQSTRHYCERGDGEKGEIQIAVFSNAREVNLLVDDSLNLMQPVEDGMVSFDLLLSEGHHIVEAFVDGAVDRQVIDVVLRSNMAMNVFSKPVCVNVGTHCDFFDPLTKEVWVHDQAYQPGEWGYVGGNVYQKNKSKFQGTATNILQTNNDPLYQTMREGLTQYRFDVPKGAYRVTLLFTEPNLKASEQLIYNLSDAGKEELPDMRVFSVFANGKKVFDKLNLARQYGAVNAVKISFKTNVEDGLVIGFEEEAGKALLSGVKIEKVGL